jgi:hypothetical protein
VEPASISPFAAWESFYVILGSSSAALIGLQFVVIVLGAEISAPASPGATRAFGTPNIVHFCAVLLNAAILSAPWKRLSSAGAAISVFGGLGALYALLVLRQTRRQTTYVPVAEDWIFHAVLPFVCYAALLVSGALLPRDAPPALFVTGGASLLLLFVGIHNAWDSVTYIAQLRRRGDEQR